MSEYVWKDRKQVYKNGRFIECKESAEHKRKIKKREEMATTTLHPNALQARVQKLLSSRAEIESTKALLNTLVASDASAARLAVPHSSPHGATPNHHHHITPTPIVTMDATSSLADLRKNLRSSLEEKQFALAESVLQGLGETLSKISLLKANVESLDTKCTHIQRFLETTKRETQQVQADAALLTDKKYGQRRRREYRCASI